MKIRLSFIVPVYNVEPYLRKCVDSLLAQDIPSSEYEIILVDDGSPDECPQICDEYAVAYSNIRVIHQENGGLSAARNIGISAANGEYICFVDSDDYWEKNMLNVLMERIERDRLDVLRFKYQNVRIVGSQNTIVDRGDAMHLEYEVFEPYKAARRYMDYSESVVDGGTFLNERLGPACYVTQFIIKLDVIYKSTRTRDATYMKLDVSDSMCLFKEGIYFEDTEWTPRMLLRARRVASTPQVVYNYLWRSGSITQPKDLEQKMKMFDDRMQLLYDFQERQTMESNPLWFKWQTTSITMSVLDLLSTYSNAVRKPYLQQLKNIHLFPLSKYRADRNSKIKISIANISPSLYCIIMNLIHR